MSRAPVLLPDDTIIDMSTVFQQKEPVVVLLGGKKHIKYEINGKTYLGIRIKTLYRIVDGNGKTEIITESFIRPDGSVWRNSNGLQLPAESDFPDHSNWKFVRP